MLRVRPREAFKCCKRRKLEDYDEFEKELPSTAKSEADSKMVQVTKSEGGLKKTVEMVKTSAQCMPKLLHLCFPFLIQYYFEGRLD